MSKETGGPAFPTPATEWHGNYEGMTLRDHFAVLAMQSLVSEHGGHNPWRNAERSYVWADAMLRARGE